MSATFLVATACLSFLATQLAVGKNFKAVHSGAVDGPVLCARNVGQPTVTKSVRSKLECSRECARGESCSGFNAKKTNNQEMTCELFPFCPLSNVTTTTDCSLFLAVIPPDPCKILIQQNIGDVGTNMNRTWNEYKAGFGDINCNYWLGNEQLYQLTQSRSYKLRVELQSRDNLQWYWAEYSTFRVASEAQQYMQTISGFTGNISTPTLTAPTYGNNGMMFSTWDRDYDRIVGGNCALVQGGGFWYSDCGYCYANSPYFNLRWQFVFGSSYLLQWSRMWLMCP